MLVLAAIDYSRFRELRVGLYASMIGLILLVLALGERDPRLAALDRAPVLPLPALGARQGPAGPGAVGLRDRPRAPAAATATRLHGSCCWRCVPALLVMAPAGPRHGIVYVVIALAVLFVAGTPWTPLRRARRALAAVAIALVLVIAPAVGVPVARRTTRRIA